MGASSKRYTAEFRAGAVKQVIDERGHTRWARWRRGCVSARSLYEWLRAHRQAGSPTAAAGQDAAAEIRKRAANPS
jgi:transposase-like protein